MKRKEFIENGNKIVKISFDKIEEKIKEYNDSKKKKQMQESNNESAAPTKNNDKKDTEITEKIKCLFDEEDNNEIGN